MGYNPMFCLEWPLTKYEDGVGKVGNFEKVAFLCMFYLYFIKQLLRRSGLRHNKWVLIPGFV